MRAVVYEGPFNVSVKDVPDPKIQRPNDAIVKITTANICGCNRGCSTSYPSSELVSELVPPC